MTDWIINNKYSTQIIIKKIQYLLNDLLDPLFALILKNKKFNAISLLLEDNTLGDLVIKLPYLNLIKQEKVLFACGKHNSGLLKHFIPEINIIETSFDKFITNPVYRYKILKKIYNDGWPHDIIILPPYNHLAIIKSAAKIPSKNRIAYIGEKVHEIKNNKSFSSLYKKFIYRKFKLIKNPFQSNLLIDAHISEHVRVIFEGTFNREFNIAKKDYLEFFSKFKATNREHANYIVLITDVGQDYRRYDQSNWQAVVDRLYGEVKIIILGEKEIDLHHPNIVNLVNKTSLKEAINIVLNAKLIIGNETGLTHLAYLSGIPTVCILGGGHLGRFLPWNVFNDLVECVYEQLECAPCGWKCKYVDLKKTKAPCIDKILPEKIVNAIGNLDKRFNLQICSG